MGPKPASTGPLDRTSSERRAVAVGRAHAARGCVMPVPGTGLACRSGLVVAGP